MKRGPWQIIRHVNHDKTRSTDRALRKGAAPDSTVGYSNILFSYGEYAPSSPIGPERPTVLQVIVALGRSQIDPISTPAPYPISERDGTRMREEESKAKEKWVTEKTRKERRGKIRYAGKHGGRRKTYKRSIRISKNTRESNTRYEKRKIRLEEGEREEERRDVGKRAERAGKNRIPCTARLRHPSYVFHDPIAISPVPTRGKEKRVARNFRLTSGWFTNHPRFGLMPPLTDEKLHFSLHPCPEQPITAVSLRATNREQK